VIFSASKALLGYQQSYKHNLLRIQDMKISFVTFIKYKYYNIRKDAALTAMDGERECSGDPARVFTRRQPAGRLPSLPGINLSGCRQKA
jgi:hypothetical protein